VGAALGDLGGCGKKNAREGGKETKKGRGSRTPQNEGRERWVRKKKHKQKRGGRLHRHQQAETSARGGKKERKKATGREGGMGAGGSGGRTATGPA